MLRRNGGNERSELNILQTDRRRNEEQLAIAIEGQVRGSAGQEILGKNPRLTGTVPRFTPVMCDIDHNRGQVVIDRGQDQVLWIEGIGDNAGLTCERERTDRAGGEQIAAEERALST